MDQRNGEHIWPSLTPCLSTSEPTRAKHPPELTTTCEGPSCRRSYWHLRCFGRDQGLRGKVHVNKDETSTRHGAWGGAAGGALVGIIFPPSIVVGAAVGATVGGVSGHLWKGMSRSDVKEFGDIIDAGQAALVIVGESTIGDAIEKADLKAEKHAAKELDVSSKDIDQAVQETARSSAEQSTRLVKCSGWAR